MQSKLYSIPEMASELDVCPETIRKYIKQFQLKGIFKNMGRNINVLVFTQAEYELIHDTIETNKTPVQDLFTTKEVAELAGCSTATVNAVALEFNIDRIVRPAENTRRAYYPKTSAEKLIDIIQCRRDRRFKDAKKAAQTITEETTPEELHPLVTDKRCLNLKWWPDVIPDSFKDLDKEII